MKKEKDDEQQKENLENRKKAIQRIKEHKIVRFYLLVYVLNIESLDIILFNYSVNTKNKLIITTRKR